MSPIAAIMLEDYKMDTVDFVSTYDEKGMEPTVLPSRFPNLLVNGSQGIAVGMATSIPPHNLGEICDCLIRVIDDPDVSIDELLEICPGPDFPTGGIVCGRSGIRQGYHTGRGTIILRAVRGSRNIRASSGSSSMRSPTSRLGTTSRNGFTSWSTTGGSRASRRSATRATSKSRCGWWWTSSGTATLT